MPYDVAIIGGGIIGCALARELTRYQLAVILIEKADEVGMGTSKANSGLIHAGHHSANNTHKGALEWAGNQRWDALSTELGFHFKRIGELTIATNEKEQQMLLALKQQGDERGVLGLEIWERERLRRAEPNLTPNASAGLYAPTTGVVNPYEACFALAACARQNGLAMLLKNRVVAIETAGALLTIITDQQRIHSRFILNAAGIYADQIAALAGVPAFRLHPRKGEAYLLDKRLAGIVRHVIFPCPAPTSKGILITPTYDGTIIVGPNAQELGADAKEDTTTTPEGAAEVFAGAQRLVPGISARDSIAAFAGVRAIAESEDFIIGTSALPGFINVAGIQSPGLTAAPAIASQVLDLLQAEGLALVPKSSYHARLPQRPRFASQTTDAQTRLAEQDHRYGQIVCRCEQVTEREIIDAIQDGARTLDGLKFRTRAGMGRCQGGFCAWRCMQLLATYLDLPLSAITKSGGGSWVVCERPLNQKEKTHVD